MDTDQLAPDIRQLLETLVDHSLVTGAACVDDQGELLGIAGQAEVFRTGESAEPAANGRETGRDASEDVYIEAIDGKYLIVAFPARGDFEIVEAHIEEVRDRLDL